MITDYNNLGPVSGRIKLLAEVTADNATLMSMGFSHFGIYLKPITLMSISTGYLWL